MVSMEDLDAFYPQIVYSFRDVLAVDVDSNTDNSGIQILGVVALATLGSVMSVGSNNNNRGPRHTVSGDCVTKPPKKRRKRIPPAVKSVPLLQRQRPAPVVNSDEVIVINDDDD